MLKLHQQDEIILHFNYFLGKKEYMVKVILSETGSLLILKAKVFRHKFSWILARCITRNNFRYFWTEQQTNTKATGWGLVPRKLIEMISVQPCKSITIGGFCVWSTFYSGSSSEYSPSITLILIVFIRKELRNISGSRYSLFLPGNQAGEKRHSFCRTVCETVLELLSFTITLLLWRITKYQRETGQ